MEIEDAPAVAFAASYLLLVLCGLVWCIGELFARWRQANPKPRQWIYGTLQKPGDTGTSRPCRKCPKTGEVQFILWWAGEQGHTEHYWHATDSYWWPHFVAHNPLSLPRIPLTATAQVRMAGNSVSPPAAAALVKANFAHELQIYNLQAA